MNVRFFVFLFLACFFMMLIIVTAQTAKNVADLRTAVNQNTAAISKLEVRVIALDAQIK